MIYLPRATIIDFSIECRILLHVLIFGDKLDESYSIEIGIRSRQPSSATFLQECFRKAAESVCQEALLAL